MVKPMTEVSGLSFPCHFPIKIVGNASDDFERTIYSIIRKHVPEIKEDAIRQRASKNGNYMAITVTVRVNSKEELDAIYQDLTQSPLVLMAL